jgi:hypothetical protein
MTTNLLATIVLAVVTNTSHPQIYSPQGDCPWIITNMTVNCQGNYTLPTWPVTPSPDPDTIVETVREIETTTFTLRGKEYSVETGNRVLREVTKCRKVTTREEWTATTNLPYAPDGSFVITNSVRYLDSNFTLCMTNGVLDLNLPDTPSSEVPTTVSPCDFTPLNVEWIPTDVFGVWMRDHMCEIGLCEDGTVIWRKEE